MRPVKTRSSWPVSLYSPGARTSTLPTLSLLRRPGLTGLRLHCQTARTTQTVLLSDCHDKVCPVRSEGPQHDSQKSESAPPNPGKPPVACHEAYLRSDIARTRPRTTRGSLKEATPPFCTGHRGSSATCALERICAQYDSTGHSCEGGIAMNRTPCLQPVDSSNI